MKSAHRKIVLLGLLSVCATAIASTRNRVAGTGRAESDNGRLSVAADAQRKAQFLSRSALATTLMTRPLGFEPNQGQAAAPVKYLAHAPAYNLFITDNAVVLALHHNDRRAARFRPGKPARPMKSKAEPGAKANPAENDGIDLVAMKLVSANPHPIIDAAEPMRGRVNYFIGRDPKQWHAGVPTYGRVVEHSVWRGIDIAYYGNQNQLEFDFNVAPGANPDAIELGLAGAANVAVDKAGNLTVGLGAGRELRLVRPRLYQGTRAEGRAVEGGYIVSQGAGAQRLVRFKVAAYDHARPLVVDPYVDFASYLGGSQAALSSPGGGDSGNGIATDASFNTYVTGQTDSNNFPTASPYQGVKAGPYGIATAFVSKFDPDGTTLVYSTYLGGSGMDSGAGIAVDSSGDAYVAGTTSSTDFPITETPAINAYQGSLNGTSNAFVTELNPTGSGLIYSTYLGGSGTDSGAGIAVDANDNIYVTGQTTSSDFPTLNAYQSSNKGTADGQSNAFVTKFSDAGTLVYSTYLGGNGSAEVGGVFVGGDVGTGIATDSSGDAYITGYTYSNNFPTTNAYQDSNNGYAGFHRNAFVTKLSADGSTLIYSTYLGGNGAPV